MFFAVVAFWGWFQWLRGHRADVLVFRTEPLAEEVVARGVPLPWRDRMFSIAMTAIDFGSKKQRSDVLSGRAISSAAGTIAPWARSSHRRGKYRKRATVTGPNRIRLAGIVLSLILIAGGILSIGRSIFGSTGGPSIG